MAEWWNNGGGCEAVFSIIIGALSAIVATLVLWFKNKVKKLEQEEEKKNQRRATAYKKSQLCDKQNEYIKVITHESTNLQPDYKDNGLNLIKEYIKICETE